MTGVFIGAVLGVGIVLIASAIFHPALSMAEAITPYVGGTSIGRTSLTQRTLGYVHKLLTDHKFAPWASNKNIATWLRQTTSGNSLASFRRNQIVIAGLGMLVTVLWLLLRFTVGKPLSALPALLLILSAFVFAGWYSKWKLASKAKKNRTAIEGQLSTVLDLLAFAVSAGEPVLLAMRRIVQSCTGPLISELRKVVNSVNSGEALAAALVQLQAELDSQPVSRAVHALNLALERGTPLAQVLRAQAADSRAQQGRMLLIMAGHKETTMMLPVVFLILPMIVAVALYPGMIALQVL
jgi:tight adherence protein C